MVHYDSEMEVGPHLQCLLYGVGAILSHVMTHLSESPNAYISRTLTSLRRVISNLAKRDLAYCLEFKTSIPTIMVDLSSLGRNINLCITSLMKEKGFLY